MLSNELIEEVIYVSSKGEFVSKELLLKIAFNIIESLDDITKSKFNEIKFVDLKGDFGLANCSRTYGIIEVDYEALINQERQNIFYSYLKSNIDIIQYFFHEIEHLNEFYKEQNYNLEARLVGISSGIFISDVIYNLAYKYNINEEEQDNFIDNKFNKFQERYWEILPTEKIAEVDSYKNLLDSFKKYPDFSVKYPKLYYYLVDKYIDSYRLGYKYNARNKKLNIPLINYLNALKTLECNIELKDLGIVLKEKNIDNNLSSLDKFKYGLPITVENARALNKEKVLLKNLK